MDLLQSPLLHEVLVQEEARLSRLRAGRKAGQPHLHRPRFDQQHRIEHTTSHHILRAVDATRPAAKQPCENLRRKGRHTTTSVFLCIALALGCNFQYHKSLHRPMA